jgi:hypothetical protein
MNSVLDNQLRSYEEFASRAARADAMDCRAVEDLIDVGLALFSATKSGVERWQQRVERDEQPFRMEDAREFESLYRILGRAFEPLRCACRQMQQRGCEVAGADRLAEADDELRGLLSLSLDRLVVAEEQVGRGQTRPLGEIRDELRRRVRG